jgi:hypothetical protein
MSPLYIDFSDVINFTKNLLARNFFFGKNYVLNYVHMFNNILYNIQMKKPHIEKDFIKFYEFLLPKIFTLTCNGILNNNIGFKWILKAIWNKD